MSEKKTADRSTLKTKNAIRNALAEFLKEKELSRITVQEIVDKADISRVTFYKYYLDVYDLYEQIEKELLVSTGLIVLELTEGTTDNFFRQLIEYIYENRITFGMVFSTNGTNKLRDKLCKLIEGTFRKIYSERSGVSINEKDIIYMCCYRANGAISIIEKWVQSSFQDPCENIVKPLIILDKLIDGYFFSLSGEEVHCI